MIKKIIGAIASLFLFFQFSNAQQQVWERTEGYQIRNIASVNSKIIYGAAAGMPYLYATPANQNTALLLDEFSEVQRLTVFGDKVVFIGRKDYASNIWITDGTIAGTKALTSLDDIYSADIAIFNNKIYFTYGSSIYHTEGSPNTTQLLLTVPDTSPRSILFLKAVGNKLIYYYYGQLGVSDGTSSAIKFLSDNATSTLISGAYATVAVSNNKLFFINSTATFGYELWSTDGTDANTGLVKDIRAGSSNAFEEENHNLVPSFTASNGKLYFVANKGTGKSVWVTDGTSAGTNELYIGWYGGNPVSLKSIDGNVYFSNNYGYGFYFSDGLNNTVQNIGGTQNPYDAYSCIKFDGSVYFVAYDDDHGYELWKTDNTAISTTRVTDICEGDCSAFNHYTGLATCGNVLFFSASDVGYHTDEFGNISGSTDYQLWKLEGSSTTTAIKSAAIQKMTYYPNPCKDYVSVKFQQDVVSVKIVSVLGNELNATWQQDNDNVLIRTQDLNPGMYVLLINGQESVSIIKE